MFLKLLLTALVIAGAILTLRMRRQRATQQSAPELRVLNAPSAETPGRRRLVRFLAAGLVLLMLAGASLYLYHQWRDTYQVVTVRVIDTRSGQSTTYRAYKGDIEGRTFLTTDERTVTLAEVERMEIGADRE
ncbi:MAG: antitermination protein NusG [Sedimenticola sp.]|nr:antitermination protein NusG [Sedimenticola sp.]